MDRWVRLIPKCYLLLLSPRIPVHPTGSRVKLQVEWSSIFLPALFRNASVWQFLYSSKGFHERSLVFWIDTVIQIPKRFSNSNHGAHSLQRAGCLAEARGLGGPPQASGPSIYPTGEICGQLPLYRRWPEALRRLRRSVSGLHRLGEREGYRCRDEAAEKRALLRHHLLHVTRG